MKLKGGLRTKAEENESSIVNDLVHRIGIKPFDTANDFPKYARKASLTRFMVLYELFKKIINVKGSIVECGVFQGNGLMTWSKLSAILEPNNIMRRVYGFDSFEGFPSVSAKDQTLFSKEVKKGGLYSDSEQELKELIKLNDDTRFLGHVSKTITIKGNATTTIPDFIDKNSHLLVSLLYLDFDLYEPTITALENFIPKMKNGAIIAFDELDNPLWPGETLAALEFFSKSKVKIQRFDFDPYVGFIVL